MASTVTNALNLGSSPLPSKMGGTGVNNGNYTATLNGNVSFNVNVIPYHLNITLDADTDLEFPTTGTVATTAQLGAYALNGANADITSMSAIKGNINLNASPATLNSSGLIISLNAAETVAFGSAGYITTSGTVGNADATSATKSPATCLILGSQTVGNPVNILLYGIATLSSWTWTVGSVNPIYLSTSGALTQTAPSGSGNVIQILATPISATQILFKPSMDFITHV